MPSAAYTLEQRSGDRKSAGDVNSSHKSTANNQLTYANAVAQYQDHTVAVYKPATFHKVDRDNNYAFPYEDISHLQITGRYSEALSIETRLSSDTSSSADKRPPEKLCRLASHTPYELSETDSA